MCYCAIVRRTDLWTTILPASDNQLNHLSYRAYRYYYIWHSYLFDFEQASRKNGAPYIVVGFLAPIATGIMSLSTGASMRGILLTSFIPAILGAICTYVFWCCAVYQAPSIKHQHLKNHK